VYEVIYDLSKRCIICMKRISERFHLCRDCEEEYGLLDENGKLKPPKEWPDWIREDYNWSRRERRRLKKCDECWVEYFDDEYDEFEDDDYLN